MQNKNTPKHLKIWRGLYVREGNSIKEAPKEDIALAKTYPMSNDKGEWLDQIRITILSEKTNYSIGEEIRIVHVVESVKEGYELYIMGPKTIYAEYVNGKLVTKQIPNNWSDPLIPLIYDGEIEISPAVDYNYEITSYHFKNPGEYEIQWAPGKLKSNVIRINVK